MCGVYKLHQVFWQAVTTAGSKEAVDLIAETGVVGVLHDCHKLNSIVAKCSDSRKGVLRELFVCCYSRLWRGDTNMRFVDTNTFWLLRSLVLKLVLLRRAVVSRIVHRRHIEVLRHVFDPSRQSFGSFVTVGYDEGNLDL